MCICMCVCVYIILDTGDGSHSVILHVFFVVVMLWSVT